MEVRSTTSVVVRHLTPSTSDDVLRNFGEVVLEPHQQKPRIIRDRIGSSEGFDIVNFIDSWSTETVVSKRDNIIDAERVFCEYARNQNMREPLHFRKIHVAKLNVGLSADNLKNYFSNLAQKVVKVNIVMNENDRSTCYGYVEFETSSSVDEVMNTRPHMINNHEISITRCHPFNTPVHLRRQSHVLYVLNEENVDKDAIEQYFNSYGKITKTFQNHSKKLQYLEMHFEDYDDVDRIVLQSKEHYILANGKVTVTKCIQDYLIQRAPSPCYEEDYFCRCCIIS